MNKSLLIAVLCFFSICAWEAQATNSTTLPSSIYNKVHNMPEGYEVINDTNNHHNQLNLPFNRIDRTFA